MGGGNGVPGQEQELGYNYGQDGKHLQSLCVFLHASPHNLSRGQASGS